MLHGLVLTCNSQFQIEELIYNSFDNLTINKSVPEFVELFDAHDAEKVKLFLEYLRMDGAAFNMEINMKFTNQLKPLKFSGSKVDTKYFIFALETNSDVPFLYEELMRINNEQSNYIRKILKERFMQQKQVRSDQDAFDELSKLNNELANLQRELSKKNVELRKLNDVKNHFLGMAAHDLRNPLGHIYNYAELIEDNTECLTDNQQKFLGNIKSLSMSMANLVNDLLDYSVIESGHINLTIESCNLVEVIAKSLELHKHLADKKRIHISQFSTLPVQKLSIDIGKIEQVLSNLITNAIKYSDPETSIMIFVTDKNNCIEVGVKDEGQGMSDNELDSLFKPFQKTSSVTTAGEASTGLGLFISKRIIEAHQGKIWVKSKKGVGSEFYFSLPKNLILPE